MENYDFENELVHSQEQTQTTQTSEEQSEVVDRPKKKKGIEFNSSWIIYGIGALAILVAVYMVYSLMFASKSKPAPAPKQQTMTQSFTPITQPQMQTVRVDNASSQQTNAAFQQMHSDSQRALNEVSQNLKAEAQFVSEGMKKLNDQQNQIIKQQTQMTQAIKELSQSIGSIQNGLDQANAQVKHMANLQQSLTSVSQQLSMLQAERTNMADPLQLSAVMPNRAWLQNSKGETIAITVGSQLQGYGNVIKIDSNNDKVYTSSGYVFQ